MMIGGKIERNEKRMNLRELIGTNREWHIRTNKEYRYEIAERELEE
jgi:hypothetical protein